MRYACGVVLYRPEQENIDKLIKLKSSFDVFLAYDNTQEALGVQVCSVFDVFISSKKNMGLAKPYNEFIKYCIEHNIDILCILDQDTMLTSDNLISIKKYIEQNKSEKTAIYAPRLKGSKNGNWVINSNSFLNVPVLKKEQLKYDEFYFLDRLDADFCMQVKKKQLSISIINDVIVEHRIGTGEKGEHSPERHFYMFRNRAYFNYKYYPCVKAAVLTTLQDMRHILIIIFKEKDKVKKWKAAFKGRLAFKHMKRISCVDEVEGLDD